MVVWILGNEVWLKFAELLEATVHLLVLVILAVVYVVKHNRLLLVALCYGTCKYPVQLYPKPSLMGTVAGTQAREARSASLGLSPLAGSRRSPLLSSVDLRSFLCWNLKPVSETGAEPESCGEGVMPWRPPCYSLVRVWELTQPWKADQAAGTMTSSGTIWGQWATLIWIVVA